MRENIARDLPRLEPQAEREGTFAVVGYGPSLRQTWGQIDTPFICTTSGAHDFLLEHGVVPTWHVEFDPRPHKAKLIKKPHPGVTYCLASVCHKNYFRKLRKSNLLLWHAQGGNKDQDCDLVNEFEDDGILLRGGSTAGLRALAVGHVLGFRKFCLYGMDCSYECEGETWAGRHSGKQHQMVRVECNGREFLTSDVMLNAADELWAFIHADLKCPVNVTGDNLFAERVKLARKDPKAAFAIDWWQGVGWEPREVDLVDDTPQIDTVITDAYRELNAQKHRESFVYGDGGHHHVPNIKALMEKYNSTDVLDYGCGKAFLSHFIKEVRNYDPAIPEFAAAPTPADIVVCTDVLEHVEPECLQAVLAELSRLAKKCLYIEVACIPAMKKLPDGRNAHLIVRPFEWWASKLDKYFTLEEVSLEKKTFIALWAKET